MIILLLIEMCLISATDCDKLIPKRIKTYMVSDFSCLSYNSLGLGLTIIEFSYPPVLGCKYILYYSNPFHENEQIIFVKNYYAW